MAWDRLITDCRLATMAADGAPYGAIDKGAILIRDGRLAFVGAQSDLPADAFEKSRAIDRLEGRWVTPGLIDCHTHLVFGGNRVSEFEARLKGASYAEIARQGGGILSTVRATREASFDELVTAAGARLTRMVRDGLTTIEIKSGYGLDAETETRMLAAAAALADKYGVRVHKTFLGLHALPPEYNEDRAGYVRLMVEKVLPELAKHKLADSVDAFLESIAFTPQEVRRLFDAARAQGLPARLHADQLCDGGGAALAAEFHALCADHLEYADEAGVQALAQAGTVAVLLPGAFFFLNEKQKPPVDLLRRYGVEIAIASDCNPGSSPMLSPLLAMSMGCMAFGLTPEETLAGMTRNAARALGLGDKTGTLALGKAADIAVWSVEHPAELSYWMGASPCARSYAGGELLFDGV